ncbi:MAG: hypothetical protein Kow0092_30440 [Deferrisomatales bacterium]
MERELTVRLDPRDVIALERCVADGDRDEALRICKALAEKVRHAQATA